MALPVRLLCPLLSIASFSPSLTWFFCLFHFPLAVAVRGERFSSYNVIIIIVTWGVTFGRAARLPTHSWPTPLALCGCSSSPPVRGRWREAECVSLCNLRMQINRWNDVTRSHFRHANWAADERGIISGKKIIKKNNRIINLILKLQTHRSAERHNNHGHYGHQRGPMNVWSG